MNERIEFKTKENLSKLYNSNSLFSHEKDIKNSQVFFMNDVLFLRTSFSSPTITNFFGWFLFVISLTCGARDMGEKYLMDFELQHF